MLDSLDYRIINLLQSNAKITIKELAIRLNLTTTPVHERIKKLERQGIIERYTVLVNREKLGLNTLVLCSVSLQNHKKEHIEEFERDILNLDEVVECYHIGGMYDYQLKVMVTDMGEYQAFVSQKLAALRNIGTVHSSFVMSEIKRQQGIPVKASMDKAT